MENKRDEEEVNNQPLSKEAEYFAEKEVDEAVKIFKQKSDAWFETLTTNNYLDKVKRCWLAHHGAYYDDVGGGHSISFGGEQGELVNLPINHFRNIAQHILVMVTSNRPSFRARSTNTDYKSLVQTKLANGLLEYYMREKRLEKYFHRAAEQAIVMGTGFIKMEWDSMSGEIFDYNEETNTPIYEGDVKFTNLSVFDVVFDSTKEDIKELDWIISRTWQNKYDIAAKYPELKEKIVGLKTKSDISKFKLVGSNFDETVDIPVYEFFHKRTPAMPEGRHVIYLDDDIALFDSPMPYRDLPVYRISPADILGTPYGYTNMFDLLPIQDGINSLYSTALTNQNAFGVQNVLNPRGCDISVNQLGGALNVIDYNSQAGKPESLNLTETPKEIFDFMQQLEHLAETLSGVNSVARGNPEASLTSGNALALIQAQALQFMSGFQQQYVQMIEDVGTGLINMLRDFASAPRVAAIVGTSNKTEMEEFTGDDLNTINRVMVDVGNPLASSTAGRVQMAEQMLQMYGDKMSPAQYLSVMESGRLEPITEGLADQSLTVRSENEALTSGSVKVIAVLTDDHQLHINEHRNVLADPKLRHDADLVNRTLSHIQEHIDILRTGDPDTLAMMGQQPLGPVGGSPVGVDTAAQGQGQAPNKGQGAPAPLPEEGGQLQADPNASLPQPAGLPDSPDGLPLDAKGRFQ